MKTLAFLIGVLAAGVALADDGTAPSLDWQAVGVGALVVSGGVLSMRVILKRWLAPDPSTEFSKALSMIVALAIGFLYGYASRTGWLVGFLSATTATFGRDLITRGWRVPQKSDSADAS